ncbi:MAG: S41 family peptidase [Alphaproteobacteria bacterium]|nr:S41 family peptidase [Alphaproteobacteria bacterium]MBV9585207.1 S41 family peptidase [Alphaproteobacteria bacterium]
MSSCAELLSWMRRSALAGARILVFALALPLGACVGDDAGRSDATGQLFTRGFDEIADLYIEPTSTRKLALAGAARLARLDDKLAINERPGQVLAVSYAGREIAALPMPAEDDTQGWGDLVARMIEAAKEAGPNLAAMPKNAAAKAVFDGMTATLDRFSRYAAPEMALKQRAARDGFGGIGVTLDTTSDAFRIVAVTPHGPAAQAGIQPEEVIVAINGAATAGLSQTDVIDRLRGHVGSMLELRVAGPSGAERTVQIQRALVVLPTVTMSRDGDIAVFQVLSFNQSTTEKLAEALAEARSQTGGRLAGIVLDLRGNPGGLLDQAVSLADLFIHDGPIVSTIGRHPASHQYFTASGHSVAPQIPVAVLINGGSASSSEIVAAALQDSGRAVVIGSSSYGKGTVQTVLRLPNDGELTLTWARLVSPAGYYLQTHGVVPTLCTSDLGDDAASLQRGLQRAGMIAQGIMAQSSPSALRARSGLDERAWSELRQSCPGRQTSPAVDLKLAEHVLADRRLYASALHAIQTSAHLARNPAPVGPEAILTGVDRALSSRQR